jgi:hypothetical protein
MKNANEILIDCPLTYCGDYESLEREIEAIDGSNKAYEMEDLIVLLCEYYNRTASYYSKE